MTFTYIAMGFMAGWIWSLIVLVLFESKPKTQWQGLTNKDWQDLINDINYNNPEIIRTVEQRLKEKNFANLYKIYLDTHQITK